MLEPLFRDLSLALRALRRQPAYAFASVLTMALGLATTTAIFAVVDATLIRPLPFADPDRIVSLSVRQPGPGGGEIQYVLSETEIVRWQAATRTLTGVEGIQPRPMAMTGGAEPAVVAGARVTSGLIPTLGVAPALGRTFSVDEEQRAAPVAVIADPLWRRRFDASAAVLGRSIALDGRTYQIVGVMPPGFHPLLDASEVWIPLSPKVDPNQNGRITAGISRLRPGATAAQAEAELAPISAQLAKEFPTAHARSRPDVRGLRENLLGDRTPALVALSAGVALLLVLACANVANLTLGHLAARRSELAMRALLGASRWRLAQQHLAQSVVVAALGGIVGVALAYGALPALLELSARAGAAAVDVRIDWRVVAFSATAVFAVGIVSGVIPALRRQPSGGDGLGSLAIARIGPGRRERRVRGALVVLQIAMAVALLCASGTLIVSLDRLLAASPGFKTDGVLTMQMTLPPGKYGDVRGRADFVDRMVERVAALPGVLAAGTTQTTFMPNESMQTGLYVDSRPIDPSSTDSAHIRHVTPGVFKALRMRIAEGRAIDAGDRLGTPPVCMVSAEFARQFWPGTSAIGHRVRRLGAAAQWMTVVGVAADVMDAGAGVKAGPTIYIPYLQANTATARVTLVVLTHGDPVPLTQTVRQAIWSVDPDEPVDRVGRLADLMVTSAGDQRFRTALLAIFAASGLLLALVGVYGVAAASVTARRWEAGVRLALGARPAALVAKLLGETASSAVAGAMLGVAMFLVFGRLLADLVYDTTVADPRIIASTVALMGAAAIGTAWLQARMISEVSPMAVMRTE
jgi:putative ABC transport system permease protein